LTNGERDLCIGMNIENRYRDEFKPMIGLFENIIPIRCQLDQNWSFHQLINNVREMVTNSFKYSYFPLQRILAQHPNVSKPAFLDIFFKFQSNENQVMIENSRLCTMPISFNSSDNEILSKFNFAFTCQHDTNDNQLSCTINASLDLFDVETVNKIAQRLHSILHELFQVTSDDEMKNSIYEFSLILPDEKLLMKSMNNTQVLFPSISCIHHEFVYQAMESSQKIAVELDEQSLTYSELLHYVQVLSLNLLNIHHIVSGEIVCQCVERSLAMVS
jgi:non-ribosomal peptide synthetase component F